MEINGKFYHDPQIQLREIKAAADRLPADSPSRPLFEFLLGYIDIIDGQLEDADAKIRSALEDIGADPEVEFVDALDQLIELALDEDPVAPLLEVKL